MEDLEIENVDRAERLLAGKYGTLPISLVNGIDKIRQLLISYEIDGILLERIADVMYKVSMTDNLEEVEAEVKYLNDTFWHQMNERSE